jgi:copper oxidase (laccase) domain-containing protein
VNLKYDNVEHFTRYYTVGPAHKQLGMTEPSDDTVADALATDTPGHALFLLIADCVATVLYDTSRHVLTLSHIGRHSAEADGGRRSVQYMTEQFGSNPADIRVWLSPAAGRENYPLYSMDARGLHEVIARQLVDAGIAPEAIETSHIDTTTSQEYFSHSRFLSGQTAQEDGRFAVVVMLK